MKVLYIGSERSDAQAIATALRGIDQTVTVSWAAHHQHAVKWLNENRDLAVLLIDAQVDGGSWSSLVAHARSLDLHPAVVVVVPDGSFESIPADVDGCIPRNQSFLRDLPVVVTRALERAVRAELERKVADADRLLAEQQAKYDIGMARAAATWEMVDEQLRAAALQVERARQSEESAAASAERLAQRESDLYSQLSTAAADKGTLERRLADAQSAVDAANARTEEERGENARRLSEQQHLFELQLTEAMHARQDAEGRHASAVKDVERLTEREAELKVLLADATVSRNELEGKLAATEAAFEDSATRATRERLAASKKAAEREAELDGQLRREQTRRADLERTLADLNMTLEVARRDRESAVADVERLNQREADLLVKLEDLQVTRETLEHVITGAEETLRDAQQRHEAAAAAAAADRARLTQRETDLVAELADVQNTRHTLESELADATSSLRVSAEREAALVQQVQQERALRVSLEQTIAETNAALNDARIGYESAASDVESLTRQEADLAAQLADATAALQDAAAREAELRRTLAEADTALRDAQQRFETALAAAGTKLEDVRARLGRELSEVTTERNRLADRLAETGSALDEARRDYQSAAADVVRLTQHVSDLVAQHETALASAATELADTRARFECDLSDAETERNRLQDRLSETNSALDGARRDHESALADVARLTQDGVELVARVADVEAARETLDRQLANTTNALQDAAAREADLAHQIAEAKAARITLEHQLDEAGGAIREAAARQAEVDEQLELERAGRAELEEDLANAQATRTTLEQTLNDTRARFVEQRQQLEIQLAQQQLEHETRSADVEQRNRTLMTERDTLQRSLVALQERSRQLQDSLATSTDAFEASRAESHRLFDQAGVAMFRCTRDGALSDANRACATLVGRRTLDEFARIDFATAVFDAPQALSWLIERCVSTRTRESIETTWRRNDGGRLFMRLSARSLPSGEIEVVAEDLTRLRVLEERLGQAHRMEAVGRLASEVATTCSNLLESIQQQGREWLASSARDLDARQRGEELFDEIARATAFLQQLAASGNEQARTPMLVDLNTIVRDLEPVLKTVAGSDVEVQLRDTSTPLNVDAGIERIERLLVNLASYGRGRMAPGGRLRIELGTSVVDRHFSAKHRNVRLGLHALITVTETRRVGRESERPKTQKPGVDFATLQGLVSECGGHLWMNVQPAGEMVAKIRLPLVTQPDTKASRVLVARSGRGRTTARWFQS